MVPSKLQKKQLPRDTRSKPGQQAEKYAQLGFRHHKHAWPGPFCKNQTRPGQKWKRKRQTATNRTSPLEAVLCCLSNHVSFRGGAAPSPEPPSRRTLTWHLHRNCPEPSGTYRNPPEPSSAICTGTSGNLPEPSGTLSRSAHRSTAELIIG